MKTVNAVILAIVSGLAVQAIAQTSPAKDMFAGKCAPCHAADGSASTPMGKALKMPSLRSAEVQSQTDAELKAMITKGKGAMPAFSGKLSNSEIGQMVAYIRTIGKMAISSTGGQ